MLVKILLIYRCIQRFTYLKKNEKMYGKENYASIWIIPSTSRTYSMQVSTILLFFHYIWKTKSHKLKISSMSWYVLIFFWDTQKDVGLLQIFSLEALLSSFSFLKDS